MKTTRREFLTTASTVALGTGIALAAVACSDSDTTTGDTTSGGGSGTMGGCTDSMISANHGHTLTVPQGDVDAAAEKTYSIAGDSPHDHEITLTAADFMALAGGGAVTVTSTSDGTHTHDVTVTCG